MRLSSKILKNVSNVNHYQYEDQAYIFEGQENEFYFQLVDLDKLTYWKDSEVLPDHPLRYMTAEDAEIVVNFSSLFDDDQFDVTATRPFPQDSSIWKVSLTDSQLPRTGNLIFTFTENGKSKRVVVIHAINTTLLEIGGC